jgi:ATP-binding cassette subfamily B protein
VAEEAISSIRTVRSFCGESKEVERYDLKVQQSFDSAKRRAFVEGVFQAAVTLLANVGIAGVLWYGGGMVVSGELSAGTLTSFILYTLTVGVSFGALSSLYGDIMKAVGASERVFQLIDRVPSVRFSGGRSMRHVDGNVDLVHVDFAYPSRIDKPVLKSALFSGGARNELF